jgi:hypothetical protein
MRFSSFIDKKNKKARYELGVVRDILKEGGFNLEDFLKDENPYVFLKNPEGNLDFEGVRIYKIGSGLAYRVQKENKTEPYGQAYGLNLEEIFSDLISDMSEEKAAKQIKKAIIEEFKNFFEKSIKAQDEINSNSQDPHNKIFASSNAGDLSNTM